MTQPMSLPSIPTDNLYKFMALTGVFMVVTMSVMLIFRLDQIAQQNTEVSLGKEALMYHTAQFQSQLDQAKKSGDPELQKKFDEGYKPLIEESLRLRQKSDFADLSVASTKRLLSILPTVFISGVLLATAGFVLWYLRLQRYQDRIVQKEALDAHKKNAKA
jgi:hypothetical protein